MHNTIGIVYHHREIWRMRAFCGVETDKGSWARLGIKFLSTRVPVAAGQNISLLACRSKASKTKYSRTHFCLKKYSQPVKQTKKREQSCGIIYLIIFSISTHCRKDQSDLNRWNILGYKILQRQIFWPEMFVKGEILCFSDRIRSVFNPCMFVFRGGESLGDISPQKEFHPNKISWIFCNILWTFLFLTKKWISPTTKNRI